MGEDSHQAPRLVVVMSETTPSDPIAVLLARIEVKLDNSLAEIGRHTTTLDRHGKTLDEHGNRLTRLEANEAGEQRNEARSYSGKTVLWTALGAIVAALSLAVVVVLALKSGGA